MPDNVAADVKHAQDIHRDIIETEEDEMGAVPRETMARLALVRRAKHDVAAGNSREMGAHSGQIASHLIVTPSAPGVAPDIR